MITKFNSGQILKGSDVEINVALTTCKKNIDVRDAEDLVVNIFTTEGGDAIQKTIDDIELNEQGNAGTIHIDWEELDMLDDGVIRTNIFYVYDGDDVELEGTTGYYLKTPIDYTPMTFITEENLDELVDEKLEEEGIATEDFVSSAITEATEGMATEDFVNSAITEATSGMASETYVNSAITQATSGLVDEEYVQNAIKENDWTFIIHRQYVQSEIDAVVDAAKINPGKMVVYVQQNGGDYCPFYPLHPYRPYDEHEVYFWCTRGFPPILEIYLLGLDKGQLPESSNYWVESYQLDTLLTIEKIKWINGSSLRATYLGENIELATPEDIQELWEAINNLPSSSAMTEAIEEATSGLASETYVDNAVSGLASENYVNSAITQATSGLATEQYVDGAVSGLASETYVNSAITQATSGLATEQYVQSAITASNLVYAMTSTNKIWAGTRAAYSAQTIDNTTLYFITD